MESLQIAMCGQVKCLMKTRPLSLLSQFCQCMSSATFKVFGLSGLGLLGLWSIMTQTCLHNTNTSSSPIRPPVQPPNTGLEIFTQVTMPENRSDFICRYLSSHNDFRPTRAVGRRL